MISFRTRYVFLAGILGFFTVLLLFLHGSIIPHGPPPEEAPDVKKHPIYKPPDPDPKPSPPPLPEYFPLAAKAKSPADLPPVPVWNRPPNPHVPESTRLYIGFTRYWPLLQQVVVSYITAGWPPEDIYVVENTGTFDANRKGLLSPSNPFYLDYHRLTKIIGVNILTTPSLQTFAQLQNMYLSEALNNNLTHYFWGHMDVVVQTHEDVTPYKSLYEIAVDTVRESFEPDFGKDPETGEKPDWAIRFFAYDWLALVRAESYAKVGGWDTMISYYGTDCDMHNRLLMNGFINPIADAGQVFDVARSLDDLEVLYRRRKKGASATVEETKPNSDSDSEPQPGAGSKKTERDLPIGDDIEATKKAEEKIKRAGAEAGDGKDEGPAHFTGPGSKAGFTHPSSPSTSTSDQPSGANAEYLDSTEEDTLGSTTWKELQDTLEALAEEKRTDSYRNGWQLKQRGGQGEPYYYDADGWEQALQMTIDTGMRVLEEKWGHRGCELRDAGLSEGDQWKVLHDWD